MWKIIFEGEYLNGERNGKGIEYVFKVEYFTDEGKDEKLLFEGDFLNGERNGKGKEYNEDDKLEFEGECLKGKKWKRKRIL